MAGLLLPPQTDPQTDTAQTVSGGAYLDWLFGQTMRELGGRVIEVGCGVGQFTRHLLSREQVIALDPAPHKVARLLAEYGDRPNLEAFSMEVTGSRFRTLSGFKPDSIVCLNGLDRVEDHYRALFNMSSVLGPGGRIVLLVSAFPALCGAIDLSIGTHRRHTKESLTQIAHEVGLSVRRIEYSNLAGFCRWWIRSRVLRRSSPLEAESGLFDRVFGRALGRVEALLHPPFGQNLFAVLEVR